MKQDASCKPRESSAKVLVGTLEKPPRQDDDDELSIEQSMVTLPSTSQIGREYEQSSRREESVSEGSQQAHHRSKKRKNHRGGMLRKEKKINRLIDHSNRQTCPSCVNDVSSWACTTCDRTLPHGKWADINLAAEDEEDSLFGRMRQLWRHDLSEFPNIKEDFENEEDADAENELVYGEVKRLVIAHAVLKGMLASSDPLHKVEVSQLKRRTWVPFVRGWVWADHRLAAEDQENSVMRLVQTLYEYWIISRADAQAWFLAGRDMDQLLSKAQRGLDTMTEDGDQAAEGEAQKPNTAGLDNAVPLSEAGSSEAETVLEEQNRDLLLVDVEEQAGREESISDCEHAAQSPEREEAHHEKCPERGQESSNPASWKSASGSTSCHNEEDGKLATTAMSAGPDRASMLVSEQENEGFDIDQKIADLSTDLDRIKQILKTPTSTDCDDVIGCRSYSEEQNAGDGCSSDEEVIVFKPRGAR